MENPAVAERRTTVGEIVGNGKEVIDTCNLAVLLGEPATNRLIRGLMILFYLACLALVIAGVLSLWVLLVLASIPRLRSVWKIYLRPKPSAPPENYAVWPLWFVSCPSTGPSRLGRCSSSV